MAEATASWHSRLAQYRLQSNFRGILEILWTIIPFAALWIAAWSMFQFGPWLSILLSVPAAGFLVRLFLIQHDCGHGSVFTSRRANDWVGRIIGVITLTPYGYWRTAHAHHHAGSGHLERRGIGDIDTLTVAEYAALKPLGRLRYWLYRHPLVIFGLGPAYLFLLRHRLPPGWKGGDRAYWLSVMGTNLVIGLFAGLLIALLGWQVLATHLPIAAIASSIGVWLFYVQHQFEETFWARTPGWTPHKAALVGSSHYALPRSLAWLTANIGLHHVHHLSSRIPFYRLPKALADCPELAGATRLTLRTSLRCVGLALWDEQSNRLVSFAEARRILAA